MGGMLAVLRESQDRTPQDATSLRRCCNGIFMQVYADVYMALDESRNAKVFRTRPYTEAWRWRTRMRPELAVIADKNLAVSVGTCYLMGLNEVTDN